MNSHVKAFVIQAPGIVNEYMVINVSKLLISILEGLYICKDSTRHFSLHHKYWCHQDYLSFMLQYLQDNVSGA